MIVGIADTHTVIWYLYDDPRLSAAAGIWIDTAASNGDTIGISSITLVEAVYLIEKKRIPSESLSRITAALESPGNVFAEIPLDRRVARLLADIERSKVPDMPDRIIAATALYVNAPVISRDAKIRLADIPTIW